MNKELPTPIVTFLGIVFAVVVRTFASHTLTAWQLKEYPHFTTPLNDLRELREMFFTYEKTGQFFAGPSQVG